MLHTPCFYEFKSKKFLRILQKLEISNENQIRKASKIFGEASQYSQSTFIFMKSK